MQNPPPNAPTAQGSFVKTPFPHLLIYALERGLNGTFELHVGADNVATMLVVGGAPAKVRTNEGVHFLGDVMVELALVSLDSHQSALASMQESPRLYGQLLMEMGAVDEARLEAGVRAQLERKVEYLFGLPSETTFSYFDQVDNLARYGGPPTPVDPLPILWRGVRQAPAWEHVDATLRRVGSAAVRITPNAQIDRFQFTRAEVGALELLRQRPMRVVDLANAKVIGPSVAQLLVYLLVVTKQVDLVENAPAATQSTGRLPAFAPAVRDPSAGPPGAQSQSAKDAAGQAFARVQLQAKQVARQPLVVEEAPVVRSSVDNRIASPMPGPIPIPEDVRAAAVISPTIPQAPPAPIITGMGGAEGGGLDLGLGGLDIGAMISTTINSSMPPPMHTPNEAFAPPAPPPSSSSIAAPPPSQPPSSSNHPAASPLTAEQSSLKQKIMERAAQISSQDYFQMLGLDRAATPDQVQKAFFALAKVWHPDRLPPALVDVKDACSKVFTHLTDAQQTLCDPERRAEYMTLLKDGGATPDDQAKIQAVLEAAMEFQKAEILLRRNDIAAAYDIAKRCLALDPEQADYLALVTWLDAQKPEWIGREKTLEKVAVMDRCLKMNENCERAYFFRGMLYKRIDEHSKAFKDFKKAAELNPRNLDAAREVRLHNMRGTATTGRPAGRPSGKPAAPETLGGLFGKLFKK